MIPRFTSADLVGRQRELEVLLSTVARPPAVVFIEGEAGIGKTRLISELTKLGPKPTSGARRVLTGRCYPQGYPFPLGPVVEALRDLGTELDELSLPPVAGTLRPLMPELAKYLPPQPEPLGDRLADAHQLFRGVRQLLTQLQSTVLILEDLHWIDENTGEFLHFLVSDLPPRLSLVLTYRSEDLPESSPIRSLAARIREDVVHARITLEPLGADEVGTLTGAILGVENIDPDLRGYLHDRSAGVPFVLEEMLRLLHERQRLVVEEGQAHGHELGTTEVPAAIRDAVLDRVARLGPDTRRIVEAASVLGQPADEQFVGRLCGLDAGAAVAAVSDAIQVSLLTEDEWGRASFRHELAALAVYESIPGPRRRQLHLKVADAIKGDRSVPPSRRAFHLREGGRLDEWIEEAEKAVEQAMQVFDEASACRILQEVLATPGLDPESRAHLARKLGLAANGGLAQREAIATLRDIIDNEPLPPMVAGELRLLMGMALIGIGETMKATEEIRRSVDELEANSMLRALATIYLAYPTLAPGTLGDHLDWARRAAEAAAAIPQPPVRQNVMRSVARDRTAILVQTGAVGAWDEVDDIPRRVAKSERRHQVSWYVTMARGAADIGFGHRAAEFLAEAESALAAIDYPQIHSAVRATSVLLDWYAGRWHGLEQRATDLLDEAQPAPPVTAVLSHLVLGLLQEVNGSPTTEHQLTVALKRAERVGVVPAYCTAAGALARRHLRSKHRQAAYDTAGTAIDTMRGKAIWVWADAALPVAVESGLALGLGEEVEALVAEAEEGLVGTDAPAAQAALDLCRGMLAVAGPRASRRHRDAVAAFDQAAARYSAMPRPYEAALAAQRAAEALVVAGDPQAGERVAAVLEALDSLGAKPDATRVRTFVRRRGVTLPEARPGRPSFGAELSPREAEVLRLATEGRTVTEIAAALVLSKRTVENHLARARRKQQQPAASDTAGDDSDTAGDGGI